MLHNVQYLLAGLLPLLLCAAPGSWGILVPPRGPEAGVGPGHGACRGHCGEPGRVCGWATTTQHWGWEWARRLVVRAAVYMTLGSPPFAGPPYPSAVLEQVGLIWPKVVQARNPPRTTSKQSSGMGFVRGWGGGLGGGVLTHAGSSLTGVHAPFPCLGHTGRSEPAPVSQGREMRRWLDTEGLVVGVGFFVQ